MPPRSRCLRIWKLEKSVSWILLELAQEFGRRFRAKKKEKNVVDFHDLEHFALEILTEPEAECSEAEETSSAEETDQMQGKNAWTVRVPGTVADELAVQYDEILVDEYQDSNEVQETLIRCVSRERFGTPNVFMVGDVKQSIYKFRLARPELFLEKYESLHVGGERCTRRLSSTRTFEAGIPRYWQAINDDFLPDHDGRSWEIYHYTEDAALHPGAAFEERDGLDELKTELLLVDLSVQPQKETESPS